uniref:Transforming acidic coiled-coil-containing protein C-terminal domain-containing protein n=1 Tax=Nothobranchius furzeri TaxID=105023 RepID=A0A8C6P7G2_NOTFU
MSSVDINDENCGVIPAGKHNDSSLDVFALEQPTGRQSILRQTENLPNRTVPKGAKVCFQTPRRDPLTKRILSPRKSVNMLSVDENNKATMSSYPDDNMPIQSKGGYQLDFDNLDAINPFQSSNKMAVTPGRPAVETLTDDPKPQQHMSPENIQNKPTDMTPALDDTLPFTPSVENSYADVSTNMSSTDSSVVTVTVKVPVEEGIKMSFNQNEETLKACAQDYLARINKEEQRYQALKAHAEEKITKANTEIAEVRFNYKAELSVLQAKLRREQLKLQSVERSLEQKEKEAEELTKLCDELISKVQRG